MDDKTIKESLPSEDEQVLAFEEAKELTIAEAVKKHQEIQVGITEEDGVLDRYIKQHRDDIESQKFDTQQLVVLDEEKEEDLLDFPPLLEEEEEGHAVSDMQAPLPVWDEEGQEQADREDRRKQVFVWSILGLSFLGLLGAAYFWLQQQGKGEVANPSVSIPSSQQMPSSSQEKELAAFQTAYAAFFMDKEQTKLKDAAFDTFPSLKSQLEKLEKGASYQQAKGQYDKLAKAIEAIRTLNAQFDRPVVVNGELDTQAVAKDGVSLTAVTTGLSSVDSLLAAAVTQGRSQQDKQQAAPAPAVSPPPVAASAQERSAVQEPQESGVAQYGLELLVGVVLQREVSRVSYDPAAIADEGNPAWSFAPGVLETILSISRQRGYIAGDQYILERVAIVNGNGYYNLFRPDGTYLFTLNCKTGYFVGNGAGHADALDF